MDRAAGRKAEYKGLWKGEDEHFSAAGESDDEDGGDDTIDDGRTISVRRERVRRG